MLFNIYNSIQYLSFVCTQWSCYKYCYLTVIILFNTIHSFAHSQLVLSIALLYQYSNLGAQLKSFKYCYLTPIILFSITHLFAQLNGCKYCYVSLTIQLVIFKKFYLFFFFLHTVQLSNSSIWPRCYHSR